MICDKFGLLKIGTYFDFQKKEFRFHFYSCCLKFNCDTSFSITEFEEILNLSNRKFEKFINSYFDKFSDTLGNGICKVNIKTKKRFLGVSASLNLDCNIRCIFCSVDSTRKYLTQEVSKKLREIYFKFLNKVSQCNFSILETTGVGEPFFYKNDFYNFLKNIPKKSKLEKIKIITNGLLIDDNFIEIVKNSKLKYRINVSVNGWDKESYKYLMGIDGFDKVFKNIKKLKELSNTNFILSFVITEYTIQNKDSFFKALKELKENYEYKLNREFNLAQEKYNEFELECSCKMGY
jgi:MoaA/NifB/PqqE/SkfB family radical SAM enzyme